MKKLFLLLVVFLSILAISGPAFAGRYDREDANTVGFTSFKLEIVNGVAIDAPAYIYGVTIAPTKSNGAAVLFDNVFVDNEIPSTATSYGNKEIEVADTTTHPAPHIIFDPPLQFTQGVGIALYDAKITIEYRQ